MNTYRLTNTHYKLGTLPMVMGEEYTAEDLSSFWLKLDERSTIPDNNDDKFHVQLWVNGVIICDGKLQDHNYHHRSLSERNFSARDLTAPFAVFQDRARQQLDKCITPTSAMNYGNKYAIRQIYSTSTPPPEKTAFYNLYGLYEFVSSCGAGVSFTVVKKNKRVGKQIRCHLEIGQHGDLTAYDESGTQWHGSQGSDDGQNAIQQALLGPTILM